MTAKSGHCKRQSKGLANRDTEVLKAQMEAQERNREFVMTEIADALVSRSADHTDKVAHAKTAVKPTIGKQRNTGIV